MIQYIQIAFKAGGKPYTYVNPFAPVAVGDEVAVDSREGKVWVSVVALLDSPPSGIALKPIVGVGEKAAQQ